MRSSHAFVRALVIPVAALSCAAFSGGALAQGAQRAAAPDASLRAMAAIREEARALATEKHQAGPLDTTPPQLRSIHVTGRVDGQAARSTVEAALDMTDDLAGIIRFAILFRSPSDAQGVFTSSELPAPLKKVGGKISVGALPFTTAPFTAFSEPGTWEAVLLYAYDANGNFVGYSQNELRALGSTTFEVRNERFDATAPEMAAGRITTPQVRLSKAPKGMPPGTPPFVTAEIRVSDSGNGDTSGVYTGRMHFCADGCAQSFSLAGEVRRRGVASATLALGTQLAAKQQPGTYRIYAVTLADVAGNEASYISTAFGGETDFDTLFPDGAAISIED